MKNLVLASSFLILFSGLALVGLNHNNARIIFTVAVIWIVDILAILITSWLIKKVHPKPNKEKV